MSWDIMQQLKRMRTNYELIWNNPQDILSEKSKLQKKVYTEYNLSLMKEKQEHTIGIA